MPIRGVFDIARPHSQSCHGYLEGRGAQPTMTPPRVSRGKVLHHTRYSHRAVNRCRKKCKDAAEENRGASFAAKGPEWILEKLHLSNPQSKVDKHDPGWQDHCFHDCLHDHHLSQLHRDPSPKTQTVWIILVSMIIVLFGALWFRRRQARQYKHTAEKKVKLFLARLLDQGNFKDEQDEQKGKQMGIGILDALPDFLWPAEDSLHQMDEIAVEKFIKSVDQFSSELKRVPTVDPLAILFQISALVAPQHHKRTSVAVTTHNDSTRKPVVIPKRQLYRGASECCLM